MGSDLIDPGRQLGLAAEGFQGLADFCKHLLGQILRLAISDHPRQIAYNLRVKILVNFPEFEIMIGHAPSLLID